MRTNNERGSVLVVALAILAVLTIIGVISVNIAQVELLCASAHVQHTKAFYNAEAGANVALADLKELVRPYKGNWSSMPDPITFVNTDYSIANTLMQFSVSITPKRDSGGHIVLWGDTNNNGTAEENTTTGYPIMTISSTGVSNGASAVVEVIARMDILFNNIPAPLYGESGINTGPSTTPNSIRALGGSNDSGVWLSATSCPDVDISGVHDVVSPVAPPSDSSLPDTTADHVCEKKTCGATMDPAKSPSFPINQTIANFKDKATWITNPLKSSDPTYVDLSGAQLGFDANGDPEPGIFYCDKNLELTGTTRIHGILMVEGNLVLKGNAIIEGIVLVKGRSTIDGTGTFGVLGAFMGNGEVTVNGGADFVYDCRAMQALASKYEKYHMLCWMTK